MGASVDYRAEESQPTISAEQLFGCKVVSDSDVPPGEFWLVLKSPLFTNDGLVSLLKIKSIRVSESSA